MTGQVTHDRMGSGTARVAAQVEAMALLNGMQQEFVDTLGLENNPLLACHDGRKALPLMRGSVTTLFASAPQVFREPLFTGFDTGVAPERALDDSSEALHDQVRRAFVNAGGIARPNSTRSPLVFDLRDTISTALVAEAVADVGALGADPTILLQEIGLTFEDMAVPGGRISAADYGRLWRIINAATDDEFFGMNPRRMKSGSFDFISRSILGCRDVRSAVRHIAAFFSLVLDDMDTHLREEDGLAVLTIDRSETSFRPFAYFTFWLLIIGLISWVVGRRIPILAVDLTCPRPPEAHCADYRVLFTNELRFSQETNRIFFDSRFLDLPIRRTVANLREFLRNAPANILVRYINPTGFSTRVTQRLRRQAPDAWPDLEEIAATLRISAATLRRHLDHEGTSFQELKNLLRCDIATQRLSSTCDSVTSIATLVGFADTSSFFRAFKKWTGLNPGEYRRCVTSRCRSGDCNDDVASKGKQVLRGGYNYP